METDNNKIIIAQKAIIYDENRNILTIQRSENSPRPLTWDLPGGNLEFGEELESSILREIEEETKIEVENLSLLSIFENLDSVDLFRVTIGYKTKAKNTNVILSHEHIDFKWVTPEEFSKLDIYEPHRKLVEQFKKMRV